MAYVYCEECSHPMEAPTDIDILSNAYFCTQCKCQRQISSIEKDDALYNLCVRITKLEEQIAKLKE